MRNENYGVKLQEVQSKEQERKRVFQGNMTVFCNSLHTNSRLIQSFVWTGSVAVMWLTERLDLSREEAKRLCQILFSQSYIAPYKDSSLSFQDSDNSFYLFTVTLYLSIFDFKIRK